MSDVYVIRCHSCTYRYVVRDAPLRAQVIQDHHARDNTHHAYVTCNRQPYSDNNKAQRSVLTIDPLI